MLGAKTLGLIYLNFGADESGSQFEQQRKI